jgi:hypothetical protein
MREGPVVWDKPVAQAKQPLILGIGGTGLIVLSLLYRAGAGGLALGGALAGNIFFQMDMAGAVFGLAGGILEKKAPLAAGFVMLAGAVLSGLENAAAPNIPSLAGGILFLAGSLFCFFRRGRGGRI